MSDVMKIGLIGFGNIGAGVVRLLAEHERLDARLPRKMRIETIADRDTTTPREAPYDPSRLVDDADAVLNDPEIEVVIELVGGEEPARTFVARALEAGKHVVTANKALLALHGGELLELAHRKGVGLLFEAAVAGGIPIIRTLEQGLSANELTSVQGIFNGTCNYILTRMTEAGLGFEAALEEAKAKGYAEPDPTYDIEGYDTAHKTAILASLAFGQDLRFGDVHVEGITAIQSADIRIAREMGYAIRLLGIAKRESPGSPVELRVHPTLVPSASPLGQVGGVYNAVLVDGHPIGPTMYYGQGAGADATSSAVVSDLMALAADTGGFNRWRDARLPIEAGFKHIKPMAELRTHYYLRFTTRDKPGVMAIIGQALADQSISIESMMQHPSDGPDGGSAVISIVTHEAVEAQVQAAITAVEGHEINADKAFVLRVEE